MRWSLILSTCIAVHSALSFVCVALAVPLSSDWEKRALRTGARVPSNTYRKNAQYHAHVYRFDEAGDVTSVKVEKAERELNGKRLLMVPGTDADHVFEHQMLENQLLRHEIDFKKLPRRLRDQVTNIINGPGNMAPVPAKVNRGKGQLVKHALLGKAVTPKKSRDKYTLLSYSTARKTAKRLDRAFQAHKYNFGDKTFHGLLRKTMNTANILKSGQPSPAGSSKSSSSGGSSRSSRAGSVKAGPRRSARIANQPKSTPKKSVFAATRQSARILAQKKKLKKR